ncbi:hypothetical protein GDO86_001616 [Hymenochirus boettgeri]|uniref:Ig-like domain-containing protein n=1 Tax=Hymenochirus boettgeri TaxID=247094 RepID=A0A8T2KDH5_9PIPI|nr:hypothetical protein GDO86_001616 [Hymenochirus boettgeri]
MNALEGTNHILTCSHASLTTAEMIHWYRQFPNEGPQFLISSYRTTEKNDQYKYSMVFSDNRKSSELHIKDVKYEESGVYLCVKSDTDMHRNLLSVQQITASSDSI